MAYLNGFSGHVLVGAFTLEVSEWSGDFEVEILDTTVTNSGGWQANINGCKKASGTIKTFFDTANVPTGATVGLTNGASVTLTLNVGNSGSVYVVPARIGKVSVGNPVKAVVTFDATFESNGVVTLAT